MSESDMNSLSFKWNGSARTNDVDCLRPTVSAATHIEEFGELHHVVHVSRRSDVSMDDLDHHSPHNTPKKISKDSTHTSTPQIQSAHHQHIHHTQRGRFQRFRYSLFKRRQLMQYFYRNVLFRGRNKRHLSREELFLDLVLVASIASLGHHLRDDVSWLNIQICLLLYMAIHSAFRQLIFTWNLWGAKDDLIEKFVVYTSFVCITGIALGALDPFSDRLRPFVAISAFLATFIPLSVNVVWASREPLLKVHGNRVNQVYLSIAFSFLAIIPYFVAAFVSSSYVARLLFWVALILHPLGVVPPLAIYHFLHRNVEEHSRFAFDIGHFVEKLEVLTMIVLGESAITLLFEAGDLVLQKNVSISRVYLTALGSTAMLYSLQTLYMQVDNVIPKGGVHALRYDQYRGIAWASLHLPYHLLLVLFSSALGIGIRDIVIDPLEAALRASGDVDLEVSEQEFISSARWMYALSWGGSLILSALMGLLHRSGPHANTKPWRLAVRVCIACGVATGLPFARLSAGMFHMIFTLTSVVIASAEFLLSKADRAGLFLSPALNAAYKRMRNGQSESPDAAEGDSDLSDGSSDDEGDDGDDGYEGDDLFGGERVVEEPIENLDWAKFDISRDEAQAPSPIAKTLSLRMQRGRSSRLVAVRSRVKRKTRKHHGLG